jgi:glycosyl transferase family 87
MANTGRALIRLAPFVLGAVGVGILLLVTASLIGSSGFGYDFEAYDLAARRIAVGEAIDGTNLLYPPGLAEAYNSGQYARLYLYPPPLAVGLVPLTALAPNQAVLAWLVLRLVLLFVGVALLPISAAGRGAVMAVAAISFPVWYDLNLGNISIVLFALSALIWRFRDGPIAPIVLAVCGLVRYPFGLVLVPWVLQRRWRAVALTLAAGVVIGLATLPFVGISGWFDYLAAIRALGDVSAGEHNISLATTATALGVPGPEILLVTLGIAVAFVASAWSALRRDAETALVVALTGTILFFPFFHPHYLVQLLIPAAFLAGRGQWWGLALPLLGWLPGAALAPVAVAATLAPLLPREFLAVRSAGAGLRGGAAEFGTDPTRP